MATSEKRSGFTIAYYLDDEALKRIGSIVGGGSEAGRWKVECSDKVTISCSSLSEVLEIPNTKERRITKIRLRRSEINAPSVSIDFGEYSSMLSTGIISYDISGSDVEVLTLDDKIKEFASGQRQWYSAVAYLSGVPVFFQAFCLIFCTVLVLATRAEHLKSGDLVLRISSWFPFIALALCILLPWGVRRLFPTATFLIGKGKDRNQSLILIRSFVVGAFIIASLGAVVGAFVYDQIPKPATKIEQAEHR